MGRITLELVRSRAEHNDGELSTLEELTLHQQDIEKMENLQRWCPRLRILYLQGNLIGKIENVSRLRNLEYLNLALNNVERVEGLSRCETLAKLDLTANFIAELTSILSLQHLPCLRELFLTGNPCTQFEGYRSWVLCALPSLAELDGEQITRAQRIRALQEFADAQKSVLRDQRLALEKRADEKEKYQLKEKKKEKEEKEEEEEEEKEEEDSGSEDIDDEWWAEEVEHTPEARVSFHRQLERKRNREQKNEKENKPRPRPPRLFSRDGRPLNTNQAKVDFKFSEDELLNAFVLEVQTYKYLDSSQLECDVQPWYVRVTIRKKILQLVLLEEVRPGQATAQRSQVTGHLVVTMPKLAPPRCLFRETDVVVVGNTCSTPVKEEEEENSVRSDRVFLEVAEGEVKAVDYKNIVSESSSRRPAMSCARTVKNGPPGRPDSPDFVDDPTVPPLE